MFEGSVRDVVKRLANHSEYPKLTELLKFNKTEDSLYLELVMVEETIDLKRSYFDFVRRFKQSDDEMLEVCEQYLSKSLNSISYRDFTTGLVNPVMEITLLLLLGYTDDIIEKLVASSGRTIEEFIPREKCKALTLLIANPPMENQMDWSDVYTCGLALYNNDKVELEEVNTSSEIFTKEKPFDLDDINLEGMEIFNI